MPRHTRTQRQRRLAAYSQRQRERDLCQLAAELRRLWRQYETTNYYSTDGDPGYIDPALVASMPSSHPPQASLLEHIRDQVSCNVAL
ncbi:MAG: hypothetical protein ACREQV_13965 [Candidatus Binatia bacterium]